MREKESIHKNFALYEAQKKPFLQFVSNRDWNETLIQFGLRLAKFSSLHFNGLLADYAIEDCLSDIGRIHSKPFLTRKHPRKITNVLHIASELFQVGGHTRVLANWVEADRKRVNHLLLLRGDTNLPSNLQERFTTSLTSFRQLSRTSELNKFRCAIRYINSISPDLIVLHTHPEEVLVPLLFAHERTIPIVAYNHADHIFWLGAKSVDATIEFRENACPITKMYRGIQHAFPIPYPLEKQTTLSNQQAKTMLGIPEDETVLLTMASEHKLVPFRDANFYEFADLLLEKLPNSKLYIIGVPESRQAILDKITHRDRILLLGVVATPNIWCNAADFFVEPTPLITGLAAFDVLRHGSKLISCWRDYSIYGEGVRTMIPHDMNSIILGKKGSKSTLEEFTDSIIDDIKNLTYPREDFSFWQSLSGENFSNFLDKLYNDISSIPIRLKKSIPQPPRLITENAR
jgi:hypothetical protein